MGSKSSHVPLLIKIMFGYKLFLYPQKFQISKTKCVYTVNYGTASYLKKLLKDIQPYQFCPVLFNVLLNRMLQEQQMDIDIRYWNGNAGLACMR